MRRSPNMCWGASGSPPAPGRRSSACWPARPSRKRPAGSASANGASSWRRWAAGEMARRGALSGLLEHQRRYHAEYRGGLSNHLSMALVALARMGAQDERLRCYARLYERRLEPAPDPGKVLAEWPSYLGRRARYADFLATFGHAVAESGWEPTLRGALPALMPGCGAAAFHPLIRLAFAIEAREPQEM